MFLFCHPSDRLPAQRTGELSGYSRALWEIRTVIHESPSQALICQFFHRFNLLHFSDVSRRGSELSTLISYSATGFLPRTQTNSFNTVTWKNSRKMECRVWNPKPHPCLCLLEKGENISVFSLLELKMTPSGVIYRHTAGPSLYIQTQFVKLFLQTAPYVALPSEAC